MIKIVFYCSGGGYGHMARSDAEIFHLAKKDCEIILASKEPQWPFGEYKKFQYVQLTNVDVRTRFFDELIKTQVWHGNNPDLSPYRKHLIEFFSLLEKERPDVVVVDSTPEIALFVKLLGFKAVYVYETLEMKVNEMRFDLAWKNSDKIIFTYPEYFAKEMNFDYPPNTVFCGGYTRIENQGRDSGKVEKGNVLISFGKGEKSEGVLETLIKEISKKYKNISVLSGGIDPKSYLHLPVNFIETDQSSVLDALSKAEIYVCGTGYNTVMEGFYLKKRIVTLPLERPYNEQIIKAKIFAKHEALRMLMPSEAKNVLGEISEVMKIPQEKLNQTHSEIVSGSGSKKAAETILEIAKGGR